MSLDTITLDDAVRLLTLPRTLEGTDGEEIVVANGRYGPFVKRGTETRSLESEEQLLTLTVEQAEALLAQPKQRRGPRRAEAAAQGARTRSAERQATRRQGRALRPVRHGRRDEREPAPWRHARGRSRSSERSSCSPKDALRARKASREGVFAVRPSGHDLTSPRPTSVSGEVSRSGSRAFAREPLRRQRRNTMKGANVYELVTRTPS